MKQIHLIIILFLFAVLSTSCLKTCQEGRLVCWVDYNLKFGFESDPPIREISVGDTFRIRMEIPHLVEDTETGVTYDIEDFYYPKNFNILVLDTVTKIHRLVAPETFDYLEVEGEGKIRVDYIANTKVVQLGLKGGEDKKSISFSVIPKTKGLYSGHIYFNEKNLKEKKHIRIDLLDTCCSERINLVHEYTSIANNNQDLIPDIKEWRQHEKDNKPKDLDEEYWTKYGMFYFVVKD